MQLRTAVIGAGMMGSNHARIYNELQGVHLAAIADSNADTLKALERRYNVATYTDYRKMLAIEKLDAVSIAVPTMGHYEVALAAMNKGLHVLLEKPISATVKEGKDIISAADKNNVKLMIGHIERFNPAVLELKKRINEGGLGRIFKIDVTREGPFPSRITDVGVVKDLASHDLDIIQHMLNSPARRVFAETEKKIHSDHEDMMAALIRFENDVVCNLNVNWLTPTKVRKIAVTGEKGMFVVDYLSQHLYFYENDGAIGEPVDIGRIPTITEGNMTRIKIIPREPLMNEIEHFTDCVMYDKDVLVTGEDGLKALMLAEYIIESANSSKVVSL